MGILTYSPLGGGWLSGRWRKHNAATPTSAARPKARFDMTTEANQRKLEIVENLAQLAEQHGMTLIPPYDHADVIAGQGTAAQEMFDDVGPLDLHDRCNIAIIAVRIEQQTAPIAWSWYRCG